MGYIILWLTLSLLLAFAMGWLSDIAITADSDEARIAAVAVTLLCIFFLTLDVTFLSGSAQEYYETKEYSVTEFVQKKIIKKSAHYRAFFAIEHQSKILWFQKFSISLSKKS